MAEKKFSVPDVLPVLPVRDTVLFPGAVLPLTVGRDSSLALVNSLEGEEKLLAVVAQLDPRIEDPAAADLHKVGTVAKVHKTVKMPNGNVVVFLEGLQRVQTFQENDHIAIRHFYGLMYFGHGSDLMQVRGGGILNAWVQLRDHR